ncbi:MAG: hypothetical protein IJW99_04355, partial [Clostridia bacterium]|nr:hypothetical protein [Clostridia bacterium]
MGLFSVRYEAVVFKFVGKLYRRSDNDLDKSMITIPCHTLNSPITCGERHGSQNGRVSEVPDVYEVCPLKPCKGGIRQPAHNRPAQSISVNSEINTPPHTHSVKAFEGVQRELFSKSSLWRVQGRALPSFAPRYLHPDKPKFERAEPFVTPQFEYYKLSLQVPQKNFKKLNQNLLTKP